MLPVVYLVHYIYIISLNSNIEGNYLICNDCDKDFYNFESVKTKAGDYLCPTCASNNTRDIDKPDSKKVSKKTGGHSIYCIDCQQYFDSTESIFTGVKIYPCIYCSSKNTVDEEPVEEIYQKPEPLPEDTIDISPPRLTREDKPISREEYQKRLHFVIGIAALMVLLTITPRLLLIFIAIAFVISILYSLYEISNSSHYTIRKLKQNIRNGVKALHDIFSDEEYLEQYCIDCHQNYHPEDSFETEKGIYPCPNCGSTKVYQNSLSPDNLDIIKEDLNPKYYCCECDRIFFGHQSFKTQNNVLPCPYCAGNHTCLDTLKDQYRREHRYKLI
jgi:Zn finger protein HypA/HybF involved in hydrogenase expression